MNKCKCGCGLDVITSEIPYEYKGTEVGTMKEVRPESRATISPVRTVTTTRQEIVPGVYGRVEVEKAPYGMVAIMIAQVWTRLDGCSDRSHAILTTDELTDAISTLTAIRDAMQANTAT